MSEALRYDEERAECRTWRAPSMDGPAADAPRLTAEALEELESRVRGEAYQAGWDEGVAGGRDEARRQALRLTEIADALLEPLGRIDESVCAELGELAMALTRQIIRRELTIRPDEIVPVVRDALSALPGHEASVLIRLHPDDRRLVEAVLGADGTDPGPTPGQRFRDDPELLRGDCIVESSESVVDARLERRIAELFAANFGEARAESDR